MKNQHARIKFSRESYNSPRIGGVSNSVRLPYPEHVEADARMDECPRELCQASEWRIHGRAPLRALSPTVSEWALVGPVHSE